MQPAPVARTVADRVRRLRKQRAWTAQQLADACAAAGLASLTRGTIAKIESGVRQTVTAKEVEVLARVLGVSPVDLVPPHVYRDERSGTLTTSLAMEEQAARLRLGRELRHARVDSGLTQSAVAKRLGCTQGKINKIETTLVLLSPADFDALVELYQVDPERADELRAILEQIERNRPGRQFPTERSAFEWVADLELDSSEILCWHSERIPGPLQSQRYMQKQFATDTKVEFDASPLARHRQTRARIFTVEDPPSYHAILSEASLLRMPGGWSPDLAAEQAEHLLSLMASHEQLSVHILTFDANVPYVAADFQLLRFAKEESDFAYVNYPGGDHIIIKRPMYVAQFAEHWQQLRGAALSRDDSMTFLGQLADESRTRRRTSGKIAPAQLPPDQDRMNWAVTRLNPEPRTTRRQVYNGIDHLARLAVTGSFNARSNPISPVAESGWHTTELRVMLALDRPRHEVLEQRRIIADLDGLTELDLAVTLAEPAQEREFALEVLYGGLLVERGMESSDRYAFTLMLPAPLAKGATHDFALQFRFPEGAPMRPHFVCVPKRRCPLFDLRIRYGLDDVPERIWRLDGAFQRDIYDPVPTGEPRSADPAGELHMTFRNLSPGLAFGARWD